MKDICKTMLEHPIATCIVVSAFARLVKSTSKLIKKGEQAQ